MKKFLTILIITGVTSAGFADIQAPPRSWHTPVRKLGRGVSNILYGITELPTTVIRHNETDGNNAAGGLGVVQGIWRSCYRIGWGAIEVVSFPVKTYKNSYRPAYQNIEYDPYNGYDEFSPELGFQSKYRYTRSQSY